MEDVVKQNKFMFQNTYKDKKVFITGHTGFKGSWLSQWLMLLGAEVKGYSLYIPSKPSMFEVLNLESKIEHHVGDVCDLETLKKSISDFQPDFVFHLAAQALVRRSYDDPTLTFKTNVLGTIHVLEAIKETPSVKAAVFITSDKCYENVEWEYGYREDDRLGGKDPYSASKACAEIAFSSYFRSYFQSENMAKVATTRAGNVIGGGDWAADRIVPDCIRTWSQNETTIIRSPKATRPWQHVLEPLSGYLSLGENLFNETSNINGESFNFGPDSDVVKTVEELLSEMSKYWEHSNWQDSSDEIKEKKEAGLLKLSCDKALHRIKWEPTLKFDETIKMTMEWFTNFYKEPKTIQQKTIQQISVYQNFANQRNRLWAKQ
jgi:CDP-glucose 4,6-dehydratase